MAYKDTYSGSYLLAVGIDTYKDPRFTPLGKAEEDAQSVVEVLSGEPYNFEATLLLGEQATRRAILTELGRLRRTDPDDRILFYFAGHGYVLVDNRNIDFGYLACADSVPDDPFGGLDFDEVAKIRHFAKAKHIGFILDACFSGTVFKMTRAAVTDLAISEYHKHRAYQVLTAGAVEVVSDARSMTGELVKVLRKGIPGHTGPMTFNHIGQRVHDVIHAQSKGLQSPIYQYLEGSGKGQMVLFAPCAIDMLPAELRTALTDENPLLRRFAIAEAEKLFDDPACGEAVRAVLEDMVINDPDPNVRQRALRVLLSIPILDTQDATPKVASDPGQAIATPVEDALNKLEKEALRKLWLICQEFPDPKEQFVDYLFVSGTYGQNVKSAELGMMIQRGWVQQVMPGNRILVTESGRKAAKDQSKNP